MDGEGGGNGGESEGGGGESGGWGGGSGIGEQGAGGGLGGDVAHSATKVTSASLNGSPPPLISLRVLQVHVLSNLVPVHVPQPVSQTRTILTIVFRNILLPREKPLALNSTVNFLRVVFLKAFPS